MSPQIPLSDVLALAPEIGLLILLVVVLASDRFLAGPERRKIGLMTAWGTLAILLVTLGLWFFFDQPSLSANSDLGASLIWGGMLRHDTVTLVFRVIFLLALTLTSLISLDVPHLQRPEYYGLMITATVGFSLMAAAADLVMIFIALETASISLYVLAGFATKEMRSSEAGMKYFVYGAFASALMMYGMSLIYGITGGQTNVYRIAFMVRGAELPPELNAYFFLAAVLIIAGFAFKISAVPFHFWAPDVYEGAPTPITAITSTASKAAGFAVFLRVFMAGMLGATEVTQNPTNQWWAMLVAMCIVTMTLGNFLAIYQTNIKRMLAYSSIAQAGYAMIGLVALTPDGSGATMFYLLMYVATNIVAFGVVIMVSNATGSDEMGDFYGLSRRSPYLALIMLLALLSLGGIPPTAGFIGKFFIFRAAVDSGMWWLAAIGILNAFVALYYYLSVVKYMYLYPSEQEEIAIPVSRGAMVALVSGTFGILYLGIPAGPVFEWIQQAAVAYFPFAG